MLSNAVEGEIVYKVVVNYDNFIESKIYELTVTSSYIKSTETVHYSDKHGSEFEEYEFSVCKRVIEFDNDEKIECDLKYYQGDTLYPGQGVGYVYTTDRNKAYNYIIDMIGKHIKSLKNEINTKQKKIDEYNEAYMHFFDLK